jgi:hypothetical protein
MRLSDRGGLEILGLLPDVFLGGFSLLAKSCPHYLSLLPDTVIQISALR